MSTIIDKYFKHGLNVPSFVGKESFATLYFGKAIKEAECIVAHNVSDYYFNHNVGEMTFPDDFPMVVPPFRTCVVECARPPVLLGGTEDDEHVRQKLPKTWGVLFESMRLGNIIPLGRDKAFATIGPRYNDLSELLSRTFTKFEDESGTEMVKVSIELHDKSPLAKEVGDKETSFDIGAIWFCSATLFTEIPNGYFASAKPLPPGLLGPLGTYSYLVDKYGYIIGKPVFSVSLRPGVTADTPTGTVDGKEASMQGVIDNIELATAATHFYPAFLAVSLMHCKNVTMGTVRPPEKLAKKREKKGGRALITYRTLEIEPMKKVLRFEGQVEKTGIKQALHITRGHFKDYRNSEKGLFGRYKGLWWWDQHLAGKPEHGTVVKDYDLRAPGQDPNPLEEK